MGEMRPSTLPYGSPIVMVKKKDGSNRVCVDFRKFNKITEVDPEPMMTAFDLTKGYWQIPVAPEDVYETAFVTPDGQYEFLRMPFGGLKKILERLSGPDHQEASEILPRISGLQYRPHPSLC